MFLPRKKISEGQDLFTTSKIHYQAQIYQYFINISVENCDVPYFSGIPSNPVTKYGTNQCIFMHWRKHKCHRYTEIGTSKLNQT